MSNKEVVLHESIDNLTDLTNEVKSQRDAAETAAANANNSASSADAAAQDALFAAGVDPDYLSETVGQLPDSTGATTGTIGAYPKSEGFYQKVEWDGAAWQELGLPFLTVNGLKVDTVADLRSRRGWIDGQTINLLGWHEPGDGGGGSGIYWDADATEDDNGGTVWDPFGGDGTPGRWKRGNKPYYTLKEFGGASTNTAVQNQAALKLLIEEGNKVVVIDDFFPMDPSAGTITAPPSLTIKAESKEHGFDFSGTSGGGLITSNSSGTKFIMDGLKLRHDRPLATAIVVLFDMSADDYLDRYEFINNDVDGRVRAINYVGNTSLDPTSTNFGVHEVIVKQNKTVYTEASFIRLPDSPTRYINIEDNDIQNFSFVWFTSGIENGSLNETKLRDYKKDCLIEGNRVFCDTSFSPTVTGTYYAFVLYEGLSVVYNNNKVEGVHTDSSIALYDAYLSAMSVIYRDNVYKNNACFDGGTTNKHLIKSKGTGVEGESPNTAPKRVYKNNKFIIEEQWVTDVGKTIANTVHNLHDISDGADVVVAGNEFDVMKFIPTTSSQIANSIVLDGNKFTVQIFENGILFAFRREIEYEDKPCSISRNIVQVLGEGSSSFSFFSSNDSYKWAAPFYIDCNSINAPFDNFTPVFSNIVADELCVRRNRIKGNFLYPYYNCRISKFISKNNDWHSTRSGGARSIIGSQISGLAGSSRINNEYVGETDFLRIPLFTDSDLSITGTLVYRVRVKVMNENGWEQIEFTFNEYYSDPDFRVAYIDDSSTSQDRVVGSGNGNFDNIEQTLTGSAGFGLQARLLNSNGSEYIDINNVPSGISVKEVEIRSFEN